MIQLCINPNWGSYAELFMACLAFITLLISACEYCWHKKRERVCVLENYNARYAGDEEIKAVVTYLEALEENKERTEPNVHQLEMYMRFCEELYFLIKSKSMKRNIAYYMFGHYVLIFNTENKKWIEKLGYNEKYWTVFRKFVCEMNNAKKDLIDKNAKDIEICGEIHDINLRKLRI